MEYKLLKMVLPPNIQDGPLRFVAWNTLLSDCVGLGAVQLTALFTKPEPNYQHHNA